MKLFTSFLIAIGIFVVGPALSLLVLAVIAFHPIVAIVASLCIAISFVTWAIYCART